MKVLPSILLSRHLLFVICLIAFGSHSPSAQAQAPDPKSLTLAMPGKSFQGPLPEMTPAEKTLQHDMQRDLAKLAGEIGERNTRHTDAYARATQFIEQQFSAAGYDVRRQVYSVKGRPCVNLEVQIKGSSRPSEIVVVGAHYDSAIGSPGANDNGSGTVALLALARALKGHQPARTLRLVAFANEESPYFDSEAMGSLVYARACAAKKENIVGMLSLETIGYYSDEPNSQRYPAPFDRFYPKTGNFVAFVGNADSRPLVESAVGAFRRHAQFPSEGGAAPKSFRDVGRSDHWAFWQCGYQALMVTDTAPFRYPYYHEATDTPDKVDYGRLARVVAGLQRVIVELANPPK